MDRVFPNLTLPVWIDDFGYYLLMMAGIFGVIVVVKVVLSIAARGRESSREQLAERRLLSIESRLADMTERLDRLERLERHAAPREDVREVAPENAQEKD